MAKWENGLKELARSENVTLPDMIKLAALTEICTDDIRDTIYQNVDAGGTYVAIKEKVISWVSNRMASRSEATPMDIGGVKDDEYGINGMNCYCCGGEGHMSKVCPKKPKDKGQGKGQPAATGKSEKGKGKGGKGGKGGDKGKGKGGGYQGTCWRCGKVGHKTAECYVRINNVEEEGWEEEGTEVEEETEVGGVWLVGNVGKKEDGFTTVVRRKPKRTAEVLSVENATGGCSMEFHMTDAKRMLASVSRITKAGNIVRFGEKGHESYIMNIKTKRKMFLKKERGVYVLDVLFNVAGGQRKGQMVIDSGAAECVMPREFLTELKVKPAAAGVKFVAANGKEIGNYGRKEVNFLPFAWQAP